MALAYDVRAKATAAAMLAVRGTTRRAKGQAVTLNVPASDGTYNPATDTTSGASAAATHAGSGVEEAYSAYSVAQGVVAAGDVKFLLSPLKTDGTDMPTPVADRDTLTKGGKAWAIKKVDTLAPAGLAVMHTLQLRSA